MNTTNRAAPEFISWELYRLSIEKELAEYRGAKSALDRLTNSGVEREKLLDDLIIVCAGLHFRQDQTIRRKRLSWQAQCGAPQEMTWQQFQRRIKSYRKLADEIDQINSSAYYCLERWFPMMSPIEGFGQRNLVTAHRRAQIKQDLARLPDLLRAYAHFLHVTSTEIRAEFYTSRKKPKVDPIRSRSELAKYVKTASRGRKPLADLATLLDATYRIFGVKPARKHSDSGVDPESLRRQSNRDNRRRAPDQ